MEDDQGAPAPDAAVSVRRASGGSLGEVFTAADGKLNHVPPLPPSTYYVIAGGAGYLDELYDGIPCEGGCDLSSGQAIVLDGPQDRSKL